MGAPQRYPSSRLSLGELIDLELRFHADRRLPRREVMERDARIAVAVGDTQPPALYRRWLEAARRADEPSIGQRVERYLETLTVLAGLLGLAVGAGGVWGWLALERGTPVNVIHFWAAMVGVQLLLLIVLLTWLLTPAVLRGLPGVAGFRHIGQSISSLIPALLGWVLDQVGSADRLTMPQVLGELRKIEHLYGRLRTLWVVRLTQVFAVAFNVGAIASLVSAAYLTDPAFGWRSTLLDTPRVEAIARTIALPWRDLVPGGVPDLDQVARTQYTTLDAKFGVAEPEPGPVAQPGTPPSNGTIWGVWLPFLIASLVCYGLVPRLLIWLGVRMAIGSTLRRVPLDHADFVQLRERLSRPVVETRSEHPDPTAPPTSPATAGKMTHSHISRGAYHVLKWAGLDIGDDEVRSWLADQHRCVAASIQTVGAPDRAPDAAALAAIAANDERVPVLLLVGAWEPPVGDYVDFVTDARAVLGDRRMIHVVLYRRGTHGYLTAPKPAEMRVWQARLAALADPWISVEPIVEGAGL